MKKIIALLLALCMVLSACVALADETEGLKDALSYIKLLYKSKPASTPTDYELIGAVPGDGETFTVEWSADSDTIAVTRLDSGMVKINVDENNPKEVNYKLTATIKDAAGNETSISFDRFVPAAINLDVMAEEDIVAVAYALDDQAKLPAATALHGTVVAIPSAYSEQYGNITVNIQVGDLADQPIQCYRLKGDGAANIQEGDEIAVFGVIKNYKGTIEFDAGCVLIPVEFCDSARVAGFAYGLEDGAALSHESTMSGVISAIPSAYSADYNNITVNIDIPGLEGYTVQCYRLDGGADLAVGDTITVTGTIKNYKGTIEFDKGCTYVSGLPAAEEASEILENLFAASDDGEVDMESLLGQLFASDGEGSADLEGMLGQLFGSDGEGSADLEGMFGQLFGSDGEGSVDFEGMLGQLFGSDGSEGSFDLEGMFGQLFGSDGSEGSGESVDVEGLLNGLFGSLFGE